MNPIEFQQELLSWYDHQKRILPWRDNPDPYHVWISEIMLQQTRVETVIPYFERFISNVPTVRDLATLDDDILHKLWEGLGYYSRASNLKKAAIKIVNDYDGVIPQRVEELQSLPGIGPYTSGAIASIAFDQPYTAVDGNVLRVFARITANKNNIKDPKTKRLIKETVEYLLPESRVGDFNQALMEIGATVCKPNGAPDCTQCPLQKYCQAYHQNLTDVIPIKQQKTKRKIKNITVLVVKYNGRYLIEKRPEKGLLASLYQFPNFEGKLALNDIKLVLKGIKTVKKLKSSTHIFSHLEWHMTGYHVTLSEQIEGLFVTRKEMEETYSIPTAFKAFKSYILGGHHE
ncbi:A/G-specific adenine glycosylase [Candidatus Xianfuyuplasma coldseepsis]|uniref:Adenine DNA glycosylase n=1 Tax=Candidatus Xianfuyuplasma coldseepsis TaxID=2782163 RepID=A0A7L7KQW2_9MOLU|nr:A/G-specific adenine glycosylase [Xianfuyuplasma coldseepsis]QMS84606.1 A/G-specific adenine glycosylase [Xianfuyuplasma coldseepsis]